MVKASFVNAAPATPTPSYYPDTTVLVPVTVYGVEGTVEVKNWPNPLKDERYNINGPLPTVSVETIGAKQTYNFKFDFKDNENTMAYGNYVYRVEEPVELNPEGVAKYDKRVYRLYITVVDDGTGEKAIGIIEAEDCGIGGNSCKYNEYYSDLPLDTNTHSPTPTYVPTPTPDPSASPQPVPKVDELYFVNEPLYWVRYTNGEVPYYHPDHPSGGDKDPDDTTGKHGTSDKYENGTPCEYGKEYSKDYPTVQNKVIPDQGWKFTGEYKYVITRDKLKPDGTPDIHYYEFNDQKYDTEAAAKAAVDEYNTQHPSDPKSYLDIKPVAVQEIVPEVEYEFNGKYYPTQEQAENALMVYNDSPEGQENPKTKADIHKKEPLKDTNTGEVIKPSGIVTDPNHLKIQTKGNITFIPLYEPKTYWVHYLDDVNGVSVHGNNGDRKSNEEDKPYGSSHTPAIPNVAKPNSGYKFTGKYKYVIYEEDAGKRLETSGFDEDKIKEFEWMSSDGATTYKWDGTKWVDQNGNPTTPPPSDAVCKGKTFTGSEADKAISWVSADGKTIYKWDGTKWVDSNGNPATPPSDAMSTTRVEGITDDPTSLIITGNIELTPIFEPLPSPSPSGSPKPPTPGWWVPFTGDPTNLLLYGGLFIGSILIILFLLRMKKKENNTL